MAKFCVESCPFLEMREKGFVFVNTSANYEKLKEG